MHWRLAPHIVILSTKWICLALSHGDLYHRAAELLEVRRWFSAGVGVLKGRKSFALAGSGTTIVFWHVVLSPDRLRCFGPNTRRCNRKCMISISLFCFLCCLECPFTKVCQTACSLLRGHCQVQIVGLVLFYSSTISATFLLSNRAN